MSSDHSEVQMSSKKPLARTLLGLVLIVIVTSAVAVGIVREGAKSGVSGAAIAPVEEPQAVTVYYFHGEMRCVTCLAIETATERVVHAEFGDEIASGNLRYLALNFDAPENRHFREKYDLAFGTVLVQGVDDERSWENLGEVWTLIHDDPIAFDAYLVEQIALMLPGNG